MPTTQELLARLPASWLRRAGELQHRHPGLIVPVRRLTGRWLGGDRVIAGGPGAGLRFNATGGIPGYLVGTTELAVQRELERRLRPGDVVHDVGASIGFLTVICARLVGPEGRVVAFEPGDDAAGRLRHNVALNGLRNVTLVRAGVVDRAGRGAFTGHSSLVWGDVEAIDDGPIRLTTIDAEIAGGLPAPDLVKLDVEGTEGAALRGMAATLRDHRPVVLCEIHDTHDEVAALLDGAGYDVAPLAGEGLSDDPRYGYVVGTPPAR
ncbi:FkbM family methyltransferase [Capillimicrobium parvum]|uniref:FkbM family methyltransferase n=1 Tax=Capillimicrobium parvum TaxID=2884022 RepID=UPI00216B5D8D|nr:FkbM family methyltransferase [Capillimicrobium parvum]